MNEPHIPQILYDLSGYLLTLICAWVAVELRLLRKEVHDRVHKTDCRDDMGAHCKRIEGVEEIARENKTDISVIKNRLRIE